MLKGKTLSKEWQPLNSKLIQHGGALKKGDMPYLSPGIPVFSNKAIDVLENLFNNFVEVLEIDGEFGNYKILKVIKIVNCLDYEKSHILRYMNSDRISYQQI